jgi:3-dehydroquinate dehydratase
MVGLRDPALYGAATLDEFVARATATATRFGATPTHVQRDDEGGLVAAVHAAVTGPEPADAIVVDADAAAPRIRRSRP